MSDSRLPRSTPNRSGSRAALSVRGGPPEAALETSADGGAYLGWSAPYVPLRGQPGVVRDLLEVPHGGVHAESIGPARDAGADLLVAGSAIFWNDHPGDAYRQLAAALSEPARG